MGKVVDSVILNGEEVNLGKDMTIEEAQKQLKSLGFTDYIMGSTPVVQGKTLSFQQINGEKGKK